MTITLPDELKAELEQGAKAEGFASVDEYVLIMYLRARHVYEPNGAGPLDDFEFGLADDTDSPERVAKRRERLNQLLQEGLDSGPPIPVTPEFWKEMRRRLEERVATKGTPK
jgi:Arc/MetJ-type ribon-helix-helix transcriptional regulator